MVELEQASKGQKDGNVLDDGEVEVELGIVEMLADKQRDCREGAEEDKLHGKGLAFHQDRLRQGPIGGKRTGSRYKYYCFNNRYSRLIYG